MNGVSLITLTLNGKTVQGSPGETILEVARRSGIFIPTLCHDQRLEPFGSCRVCLVKVEGAKALVPACSTKITPAMVVETDVPEALEARRMSLSLLISDHYGDCVSPCHLRCPAGIDIQGYIALISTGKYQEAVKLIKETNPMPLSIGRVCPHPCEDDCRRKGVEEPVAINNLKRFAADYDIASEHPFIPEIAPDSGKKVAVIGAGPAGLTAAYYLAVKGHEVTVFEKEQRAGGMLRYGIPEYRLPKNVLDREIELILKTGAVIEFGRELGRDFTLDNLVERGFHAVLTCTGAWKSISLRVRGEDCRGVVGGIEFLHAVSSSSSTAELNAMSKLQALPAISAMSNPNPAADLSAGSSRKTKSNINAGSKIKALSASGDIQVREKKVLVVGGGNTAIDAARTALRLGAADVTLLYRRTREEMPANDIEIAEAEEEGLIFEYLSAPVSIAEQNGRLEVECIRMKLGEPDESGRRRPVPVEGSSYKKEADILIAAIGQSAELGFLRSRDLITLKDTVKADTETGTTKDNFIFAAGDCVTGPATVIEAIAGGRRAALSIDHYLRTGERAGAPPVEFNISKGSLEDMPEEYFELYEKAPRVLMPALEPEDRKTGFSEIEKGLSESQALSEASRCLECGCLEGFSCALRDHSTVLSIRPDEFEGAKTVSLEHVHTIDRRPPIERDPNKCIKCGICVRICDEVWGLSVYGFMERGFETEVSPSFGVDLAQTECDLCGQCAGGCPTGALSLGTYLPKPGPFRVEKKIGTCVNCSLACSLEYNVHENMLIRTTCPPMMGENEGNLCVRGRFGFGHLAPSKRCLEFQEREGDSFRPLDSARALLRSVEILANARRAAVITSTNLSNEEYENIYRIAEKTECRDVIHIPWDFAEYAREQIPVLGKTKLCENLARDIPVPELRDLKTREVIFAFNILPGRSFPIMEMHLRRAAQLGARLFIMNENPSRLDKYSEGVFRVMHSRYPEILEFLTLLIERILKKSGRGSGKSKQTPQAARLNGAFPSAVSIKPEKLAELAKRIASAEKISFITDEDAAEPEAFKSFVRLAASVDTGSLLLMRRGTNPLGALKAMKEMPLSWTLAKTALKEHDAALLYNVPSLFDIENLRVIHVGFSPFRRYGRSSVFVPSSSLLESGGTVYNYCGKKIFLPNILHNENKLENVRFLEALCRGL